MAARYWRITCIDALPGLELSAAELYADETRIDASATVASTFAPTSGSVADLQDGSHSTSVVFAAADVFSPPFAISWTFAADVEPTSVRLAGGTASKFPFGLSIQYSKDGVAWTTSRIVTGLQYPGVATLLRIGIGTGVDDLFAYTAGIFNFDGTAGSTTFTDSCGKGKVVTPAGNTQISTTQSKFGGSSLYLDGVGDKLTVPVVSSLTLDWTVEFWFYATTLPAASVVLFDMGANTTVSAQTNGTFYTNFMNKYFGTSGSYAANTWVHVAFTKSVNTFYVFVNGAQAYAQGIAPQYANWGGTMNTTIGTAATTSMPFYIDGLRVTEGVARYTGAFTASTAAPPIDFSKAKLPRTYGAAAGGPNVSFFPTPALSTVTYSPDRINPEFGFGTVQGSVKKLVPPSSTMNLMRRVRLLDERSLCLVDEVWSDPVTGQFTFSRARGGHRYVVAAYDHLGQYRAALADGVEGV